MPDTCRCGTTLSSAIATARPWSAGTVRWTGSARSALVRSRPAGRYAFLGNFPQAFTHLPLTNSAINLDLYETGGGDALLGTHADRTARAAPERDRSAQPDSGNEAAGLSRATRSLGSRPETGERKVSSNGQQGVPLDAMISGEIRSHEIEECARCGSRFPTPGVEHQGRHYCCDRCAMGPSSRRKARMMVRMAPMLVGLVGAGAFAGWLAARGSRKTRSKEI